jgi:hypothetical protein
MISTLPIPWVIEAANNGDSSSQLALGMLCYSVKFHEVDIDELTLDSFSGLSCNKKRGIKEAEFWFRRSSNGNEPLSTLLLAYTLELRKTTIKEKMQMLNFYLLSLKFDKLSNKTMDDVKYRVARLNLLFLDKDKGVYQLNDLNTATTSTNLVQINFS